MAQEWRPTERVPTCSLGWNLIRTWAREFPSPRDENKPLILTAEQALVVVEWYTLHPRTGKFVYRRGCSRRSKGTGKSPLEAAKAISELALDVRFDGWNADGEPVARPWGLKDDPLPWVQIASLSEDQDENTYSPLLYFLTANDGRLADNLRLDAGQTRTLRRAQPSAKIEPVTSRAGSREGQPITYATLDETGLMTRSNGGWKLAKTVERNARKMGGRVYQTTNGFMPGEGSVAEDFHQTVEKGGSGLLYDAVEAPREIGGVEVNEQAPDEVLRQALGAAYGDAWWVDLDRIVRDIRDHDVPWADSERYFFNWNKKSEAQAIDVNTWDALRAGGAPAEGARIGIGFTGAVSAAGARTVLYGCTESRHLFQIAAWSKPVGDPDWRVPRREVHDALAGAFDVYDVGRMFVDPAKWYSETEQWVEQYGDRVLVLDTNQAARFAPLCDRFVVSVEERALTHDGNGELRASVAATAKRTVRVNADENDGRTRFVIVKADNRRIDDATAAILALAAAETMPEPAPAGATHLW